MNIFPHFILLFDNVFFAFSRNATQGFRWYMLVLLLTDAETLGLYYKVHLYYDYYM